MREKLNKLFQRTLKPMKLPPGCRELDEEIDTFLASVDCDKYNENYFDSIINITCNLGITDIDRQAQAHKQACLGIRELQNVELQRLRLEKQELETQILENEEEEKTYA